MTRKRFVKLLMSEGVQRNAANAATQYVGFFGSYQAMWDARHRNKWWTRLHGGSWNTGCGFSTEYPSINALGARPAFRC